MAGFGTIRRIRRIALVFIAALAAMAVVVPAPAALSAGGATAAYRLSHVGKQAHLRKHHRTRKHRAKVHGRNAVAGQKAKTPIPGVIVSPNGWVHYEESPQAYFAAESDSTRAKIAGEHLPGGGCGFKEHVTVPPNVREVVEEEIAFNPETCESIVEQKVSLKPPSQKTESSSGARTSSSSSEIQFKSGHTKTQWVDPPGITITSVNADLTWPVGGPTAGVRGKAYQYAFNWDGWQKSGLKESTVYKISAQDPNETIMGSKTYNYSDGWSFHAHEDFTNTDFYQALLAVGGMGIAIVCDEKGIPAVFHHAVKVTGYRSGQMGYWRETTKKGACNNLVHKVERIGWGKQGPENEKFHLPGGGGILSPIRIPTIRFAALEEEYEIGPDISPGVPVPVDTWVPEGQITQNSALLEGTVDPEGRDNVYRFECGTTEAYGMWSSPLTGGGTGSDPVGVSATVPNLTPSTTYHCRLVVLASLGDAAKGPDQTFTTKPPPPTPPTVTTDAPSEFGTTTAKLNGSVYPNGSTTKYYFQYGTTTAYGNTIPISPGMDIGNGWGYVYTWNVVSGLEPGTAYHFRNVATNAGGTSYGADQTFITAPPSRAFFIDANNGSNLSMNTFSASGGLETTLSGHSAASERRPAVITWGGRQHVFFVDGTFNNSLSFWAHFPLEEKWQPTYMYGDQVAPRSSPAATTANGIPHVFFVDANRGNKITDWTWNPTTGWQQVFLASDPVAAGTSPTVVSENGDIRVFFVNASNGNTISSWVINQNGSGQTNFGGDPVAAGSSPSAVKYNGDQRIFFVNASKSNTVSCWVWNAGGIGMTHFGGPSVAANSSPSVINNKGDIRVYFSDASRNRSISAWVWNQGGIGVAPFYGDQVTPGSSPSALLSEGTAYIYFSDANRSNKLSVWVWGSSIQQIPLNGHSLTEGTTPGATGSY
jgi:hypothetical protein